MTSVQIRYIWYFEMCLKHAWSVLEACLSLKLAWSVLEACLKRAWSVLEACLKRSWRVLEGCLKGAWSVLEGCLEPACVLEGCLKRTWSVLEACLKWVWSVLALNTLKHSKYTKVKKGDGHTDERTEWHLHFLSCSSELKISCQKNIQVKKNFWVEKILWSKTLVKNGWKNWWNTKNIKTTNFASNASSKWTVMTIAVY